MPVPWTLPQDQPPVADDLFRLLVECVTDYAIFALDTTGHVVTWNVGARRLKGYAAEEILGKHFSTFYPLEDVTARKPDRELEEAARVGRFEDEGWRIRKDGSRFWANVVITALRDRDGVLRGFGKVTRDLTARRASEEAQRELAARRAAEAERALIADEQRRTIAELRRAEEEARTIGQLQELFVAIVGHDLRTPLSVISFGASTVLHHGGLAPEQVATMNRIARGAQRMRQIIAGLLDVTRARQGLGIPVVRRQADLAEVARGAVAEFGAQEGDRVPTLEASGATTLEGDPERLLQVVSNLVGNAVQHGTGAIRVEVEGGPDEVALAVHNEGPRIPPEAVPHLFEPFRRGVRGDGSAGSVGLGLFIVREVVRAHGGRIEVQSDAARTTFRVVLPRRAEARSAPAPSPPSPSREGAAAGP
jgi:PAS domain S-box-containing protein